MARYRRYDEQSVVLRPRSGPDTGENGSAAQGRREGLPGFEGSHAAGPEHSCGIKSAGTLTFIWSTVTENGTDFDGGGLCGGFAALIVESSMTSNGAGFSGGTIAAGPLIIQNSTIARHTALQGSGGGNGARATLRRSK